MSVHVAGQDGVRNDAGRLHCLVKRDDDVQIAAMRLVERVGRMMHGDEDEAVL